MVRNEQKKVKRERHEREKEYMKALQELAVLLGSTMVVVRENLTVWVI